MEAFRKIVNLYNNFEKWILISMMGAMVIIIFAGVITRYIIGQALFWAEESGIFLFVWASWLGCSVGLREREHIQVKLLPNALRARGSLRAEKLTYLLINALWFLTSLVLAFYGTQMMMAQMVTGVYGPATGIPIWVVYFGIVFSAYLVCLRLLADIITGVLYLVRSKHKEEVVDA